MTNKFEAIHQSAGPIEGMLSDFSMAAMDSILQHQEDNRVGGHLLEFGVYRGRSLSVLAHHVKPGERLIGVDVAEYIDRERITAIAPNLEFCLSSSETFKGQFRGYSELKRKARVVHVDSSHFFSTTIAELEMCEELLADRGIAILDDFTNLDYSQILAATYKYLYTRRTNLTVFLVTTEKAYLCRKQDFNFYGQFVLDQLVNSMTARRHPSVCISRTDINADYRAFNLRMRIGPENDSVYGRELYKQYYQAP
jgi:hypothetical protein